MENVSLAQNKKIRETIEFINGENGRKFKILMNMNALPPPRRERVSIYNKGERMSQALFQQYMQLLQFLE